MIRRIFSLIVVLAALVAPTFANPTPAKALGTDCVIFINTIDANVRAMPSLESNSIGIVNRDADDAGGIDTNQEFYNTVRVVGFHTDEQGFEWYLTAVDIYGEGSSLEHALIGWTREDVSSWEERDCAGVQVIDPGIHLQELFGGGTYLYCQSLACGIGVSDRSQSAIIDYGHCGDPVAMMPITLSNGSVVELPLYGARYCEAATPMPTPTMNPNLPERCYQTEVAFSSQILASVALPHDGPTISVTVPTECAGATLRVVQNGNVRFQVTAPPMDTSEWVIQTQAVTINGAQVVRPIAAEIPSQGDIENCTIIICDWAVGINGYLVAVGETYTIPQEEQGNLCGRAIMRVRDDEELFHIGYFTNYQGQTCPGGSVIYVMADNLVFQFHTGATEFDDGLNETYGEWFVTLPPAGVG